MELRPFDYIRAASLAEAAEVLGAGPGRAVALAGGTDVLGALRDGIHPVYPERVLDLKGIPGLAGIRADRRRLRLGALATLDEVAAHPAVVEGWPALARAARTVASAQIRNMATVAGNICQEPRCWYYRYPENGFFCSRKGGNGCPAVMGENRYHSIFGAVRALGAPCGRDCPAHVDIAYYLSLVRRGNPEAAARLVMERNPLPGITGRVCPHYCELGCNRGHWDGAVSVREIERGIGDRVLAGAGLFYRAPRRRSGKHVAVVGSGPAGLTAAYFLRRLGHEVTVFEAMPEAGGMLRYGIPAYRLPGEVVGRQVAALEGMGIRFRCGARVGAPGLSLRTLRARHDGIFLATGAWDQKGLRMAHADRLTPGLDFLRGIREGSVTTTGRRVLVVGGGSVALDVAISALRLGAEEVTIACLESRETMPAFPEDVEQALQERVRLLPSWGPHRVLVRRGALAGLELARCTRVWDAEGRFAPQLDQNERLAVEADQVILAIGQHPDLAYAGPARGGGRPFEVVDPETGATTMPGVYLGGDAAGGAATVVAAIAAGRRAAMALDRHLGGRGRLPEEKKARSAVDLNPAAGATTPPAAATRAAVGERSLLAEDRASLPWAALEAEAQRCFNCGGCVAVNASDLAPVLVALQAVIRTTRRRVRAEEFFAVAPQATTILGPGELVQEIEVPRPAAGTRQCYLKFRIRHSLDFPIASVAATVQMAGGRVRAARLVLGAAAPVPHRAQAAEDYLVGRQLEVAVRAEAAARAVAGAIPLGENRYKIAIFRTLVERALEEMAE